MVWGSVRQRSGTAAGVSAAGEAGGAAEPAKCDCGGTVRQSYGAGARHC